MNIFIIILICFVLYLILGIIVTYVFFRGRSVYVGAAPLILIGPFIWPIMVNTMTNEKFAKLKRKKENAIAAKKSYNEAMQNCPIDYATACKYVYSISYLNKYESIENAYDNISKQLMMDNIPVDKLEIIRHMADMIYPYYPLSDIIDAASPLLHENSSPAQQYMGAYIVDRVLIRYIPFKNTDYPLEETIDALKTVIKGYEIFIKDNKLSEDYSMMLRYASLYALSNDENSRKKTIELSEKLLFHTNVDKEFINSLLWYIYAERDSKKIVSVMERLEKKIDKPLSWGNSRFDVIPIPHSAEQFDHVDFNSLSSLITLISDQEDKITATYYLLSILFKGSKYTTDPVRHYRSEIYGIFYSEEEKDIRWVDMVIRRVKAEMSPEKFAINEPYFLAERAFMNNDKEKALKLLKEYYSNNDFQPLSVKPDIGPFEYPKEWEEFEKLKNESI